MLDRFFECYSKHLVRRFNSRWKFHVAFESCKYYLFRGW
jgi:hypothetical protein